MVIWRWTYGKGSFTQSERKPAAATTWATLLNYEQGIFYMQVIERLSKVVYMYKILHLSEDYIL